MPSTPWLLLAIVAFTVVAAVAMTGAVDTSSCPSPAECFEDTSKLTLSGVWIAQAVVAGLAVLASAGEYATGTIQATLAATPRRRTVLLGKSFVVTATVLVAGALGVLGAVAAGRAILPGGGFTAANGYPPLSLGDGPTLRAAFGTVLYLGLIALLSLGVGMIIRDTAGAITAVLSLLYIAPMIVALVGDPHWQERLQKLSPVAGLWIQTTIGVERLPLGPWAGLGVLAAYAGAAVLLAAVLLEVRDA